MADRTPTDTKELNELHRVVAKLLREQLEATVIVTEEESGEVREIKTATPALIAQAIKFLKDNDITALPEDDENIESLRELLNQKQHKGRNRLSLVQPQQAAGED